MMPELFNKTEHHKKSNRTYTIQVVLKTARVLKAFSSTAEVLELKDVVQRSLLNKGAAFRILESLVDAGLVERAGRCGYRTCLAFVRGKRYRIGYASQSNLLPFTAVVTDSLMTASSSAGMELLTCTNKFSPKLAIQNVEKFIAEKVDLVIDSQINIGVAAQIAAKLSDAGIPMIAIDIPIPGAVYFGADNYKAGRMAGRYLARWTATHWSGNAKELILLGVDAAGPLLNARLTGVTDGIHEGLPEIGGVPVHHYDTKGGQFEATLDLMRKHLRRRKVEKALIGAVNDSTALAALQAFREAGIENECAVAGQDGSVQAREEMRRPGTRLVCSVAYFAETYGTRLVGLATDILSHKIVPPAVFIKHEVITPDNVNKIYPNDAWLRNEPRKKQI